MKNKPKKSWTKPVLRKLEPTDELLKLLANNVRYTANAPVKYMK